MTASPGEKRNDSFEQVRGQPTSSNFVASRADSLSGAAEPSSAETLAALDASDESEDIPMNLRLALRAARTPLIAGIDFKAADLHRDALLPGMSMPDLPPMAKSRIDTLSPLESVPPPAPYPAEPPPHRPSVVPPVRRPYADPHSARARDDARPARIRSDPPPRIPISDRPSRPAYRSEPPQRMSRSDPPPQSSSRGPSSYRRSWGDGEHTPGDALADSLEARKREAVTIPADAHSPSQAPAYDPSMPLPALRAASFPTHQLPSTFRQHENSRLRNVAMTMMFVIFIVTGAIAGMRWYVARDNNVAPPSDVVSLNGPRTPRMKLDRLPPNATVAPKTANAVTESPPPGLPPVQVVSGSAKASNSGKAVARGSADADVAATSPLKDPTAAASPWKNAAPDATALGGRSGAGLADAGRSRGTQKSGTTTAASLSSRKSDTRVRDPKKIDTKTPLITD